MNPVAISEPEVSQTSEQLHDVCEQPEAACPLIDAVLQTVRKCMDEMRGYERMSEDNMREALDSIETHLSFLIGYKHNGELELIRARAAEIRQWGQEWKQRAKEYHKQLQPASPQ